MRAKKAVEEKIVEAVAVEEDEGGIPLDMTVRDMLERTKRYKMKVGTYPEEIKVFCVCMKASGYTYSEIQKIIKVARPTICAWVKNPNYSGARAQELSEQIKRNMPDKLLISANTVLEWSLKEEKLEKAPTRDLAVAAGIFLDKRKQLQEGNTLNINITSQHLSETVTTIKETTNEVIESQAKLMAIEAKIASVSDDK